MTDRKIVDYSLIVSSQQENSSSVSGSRIIKFEDEIDSHIIKSTEHEFSLRIKHLIRKGFIPLGSVSIFVDGDSYTTFAQAMVKYEEEE